MPRGFDVLDAPSADAADDDDQELDDDATEVDDVDLAVAVGDDLERVAWARSHGLPCVLVREGPPAPAISSKP